MRITTKAEYVWSERQNRYILIRDSSINWTGVVVFCKGASAQQNELAAQQGAFYSSLTNDYNTQFANQSAILGSLVPPLTAILDKGANQYGYSVGQTNALNSTAIQGTGQQYTNAARALNENQAAQGGGNSLLPSGVNNQQQASLASAAANQSSSEQLGITTSGYALGNSMFNNAVSQLGGVAGMYDPTGYSGSATSAGSAAGSTYNQIAQENQAASPGGAIGGLVGGAAGAFLGGSGFANMINGG
jgi:hypothetical protein